MVTIIRVTIIWGAWIQRIPIADFQLFKQTKDINQF